MLNSFRRRSKSEWLRNNFIGTDIKSRKGSHLIKKSLINDENNISPFSYNQNTLMTFPLQIINKHNLETESSALKPAQYNLISNFSTGKKVNIENNLYLESHLEQPLFPEESKEESSTFSQSIECFSVNFKNTIYLSGNDEDIKRNDPRSSPLPVHRDSCFMLNSRNQLFKNINMDESFIVEVEEVWN